MDTAKNTDLPDLMEHLGYLVGAKSAPRETPFGHSPLRSLAPPLPTKPEGRLCGGPFFRVGSYYTTREMDSLMIKDRRTWKRYSENTGGDAITFLQRFENKDFREAVNYLLEFNGRARSPDEERRSRAPPEEEKRPEFALPPANGDNRRVYAYLRKRGITPQIIRAFLNTGLLYEDERYHNCVFVGRDGNGQPKFACKRGTYDKDGASFKRDVLGSDKSVAFPIPCDPAIPWVLVFEAPIDLMSFCTLNRMVCSNAVALCGLYPAALDRYQDYRFDSLPFMGDYAYEELTGRDAFQNFDPSEYHVLAAEVNQDIVYGDGIGYPYTWSEAAAYLPKLCAKYMTPEELQHHIRQYNDTWNVTSPAIKLARATAKKSKKIKTDRRNSR